MVNHDNQQSEEVKAALQDRFKFRFEPELVEEIATFGAIRSFSAGDVLMDIGSYIKSIPVVLEGSIKVFRDDEDGHELLLYYLQPGDACAISLVCTLKDKTSQIKAVASEETRVVMIPLEKMDHLMMNYRSWYRFVVETYGDRLNEMLRTIDSIAFHKMDDRLLTYLKEAEKASGKSVITGTHQEIAYELNTSREVVSRLLKQLEKRGVVSLGRNKITLLTH